MSKRFVTLFPGFHNVHLTKAAGMIPYILYKYYNYDSKMVNYPGISMPYLKKEVKGIKIDYLRYNTGSDIHDGIKYLEDNAQNIDILHLFHPNHRTYRWINAYKQRNPKGKVYLKMDISYEFIKTDYNSIRWMLERCDLISVARKDLYNYINKNWPIKVEYIPNGFFAYDYDNKLDINYSEKENIILTAGRIGIYQKATNILLEGFAKACNQLKDWKLKIIGTVHNDFKQYINNYFIKYPHVKDKVIFTGLITDREKLSNEYRKAKIFCLSSRFEGFPTVYAEAAQHGCYIIGSNIGPTYDITCNGKYGDTFPVDNSNKLSTCLIKNCSNEANIKKVCPQIQNYAYDKFNWKKNCGIIHNKLNF
jgi:glycosyltransferase involved in cell wall biosynthesis